MASSVEQPAARDDVDEIELELLLEGVYRCYGFRGMERPAGGQQY